MSTVLWANSLVSGEVISEEVDYYWLYKYQSKLDRLCKALGLTPISDFCDTTALVFDALDEPLPDGDSSTNDMMAREGLWISATEATTVLKRILNHITEEKINFGLLGKDFSQVVDELHQSAKFADATASQNPAAKFNFCVVT